MRELAVRMAIGGGRVRLVRQLLTEGLLIAAGGAIVGFGAGYGVLRLLQSGGVVSDIGVRIDPRLDLRVLVVGLAAAVVSVIASSLLPAWQATRTNGHHPQPPPWRVVAPAARGSGGVTAWWSARWRCR